jgi:hypothetical protein
MKRNRFSNNCSSKERAQLLGINMLCTKCFAMNSRAVVLEKEHGFSHKDYIDLTGELDIFNTAVYKAIHGQSQNHCEKGGSDHVPTAYGSRITADQIEAVFEIIYHAHCYGKLRKSESLHIAGS